MSKKIEQIKCCPFCGGHKMEICLTKVYWIRCEMCGADSESSADRETAIAYWNRREEPNADFATVAFDGDEKEL